MIDMHYADLESELLNDQEWYKNLTNKATGFMRRYKLTGALYKPDDAVRQYLKLYGSPSKRTETHEPKSDSAQAWEGIIAVELQGYDRL